MILVRLFLLSCLAVLPAASVGAQSASPNPDQSPTLPTITFERVWEAYTPQSITFSVTSTGTSHYVSTNPLKPKDQQDADPVYTLDFTMSERNRNRLFNLARQAGYFNGNFSFTKHAVSSTGKKTLTFADDSRHFQTTYDYSEHKAIEEITNLFLGISNAIEYGRKLQFLRRFDKLGLEAELKGMESAAEGHNLEEIQVIAPTLESIANDPAVLHIARERAKRLLSRK